MLQLLDVDFEIQQFKLLDQITFDVKPGTFVAILGSNGAGKSTLLSYISNEFQSNSKGVIFKNKEISSWDNKKLPFHKAKFSQQQATDIPLNVEDVVLMGRYGYFDREACEEDREIVDEQLKRTQTLQLKERKYNHLSGGEKQRVHLARVFAQLENEEKNKLLLLDEPLNNLDVKHQFNTLEMVKAFTKKQNAAIVVMHDINLAAQFADKILLLKKGRILGYDTPNAIITSEIISDAYGFSCMVQKHPIYDCPLVLFV